NGSVMGSTFSRYKTPAFVNLDFTPTFTGHLLRKDFELGLEAARQLDVPLPVAAVVHQIVVSLIGGGLGDEDFAALLKLEAGGATDIKTIRYLTSTTIGEWARDKVARFAILTRTGDPILWDFGSAAKAHRLHAPWLKPENSRAGMTGLRGSVAPEAGLSDDVARTIKDIMREQGVAGEPLGVDIAEM